MSEHAPEAKREATAADAVALAQAGAQAAANAQTADQARRDVTEAVQQAAEDRGLKLSDDDVKRVVDGLVVELEKRGAFDTPDPTPPPSPQSQADGATSSSADGGSQQGSAAQQQSGSSPIASPTTSALPSDEAQVPRKKSWAEKFLGE